MTAARLSDSFSGGRRFSRPSRQPAGRRRRLLEETEGHQLLQEGAFSHDNHFHVLVLFCFFAPGCCFEAAVTENQQLGGVDRKEEAKKKEKKTRRRRRYVNAAGINNVLKKESMRIQLPSNLPPFHLDFQKHVFAACKGFHFQMTLFLSLQEVYLLSKKRKYPPLSR